MVGRRVARKALARALAQVVLSRETLMVHAESVLDHPELVEGSLHSSAMNLWFAVLQRAEAEGAVERLVASVLEENPGADPLRLALRNWQLAAAAPAALPPPLAASELEGLPADGTQHGSQPLRRSQKLGEYARWLVLLGMGVGLVWRLVPSRPEQRAGSAAQPQERPTAALKGGVMAPGAAAAPDRAAPGAGPAAPLQVEAALRARTLQPEAPLLDGLVRDAGGEREPLGP